MNCIRSARLSRSRVRGSTLFNVGDAVRGRLTCIKRLMPSSTARFDASLPSTATRIFAYMTPSSWSIEKTGAAPQRTQACLAPCSSRASAELPLGDIKCSPYRYVRIGVRTMLDRDELTITHDQVEPRVENRPADIGGRRTRSVTFWLGTNSLDRQVAARDRSAEPFEAHQLRSRPGFDL